MKFLRETLLANIISNDLMMNKYSIAYNSLKAVIELEKKEETDKLPTSLFELFNTITKSKDNLSTLTKNTPLLILEQYYMRNLRNLNREVYIDTDTNPYSIKITDLYLILEEFHNKIYLLAISIADYYQLNIKLKKTNSNTNENYI